MNNIKLNSDESSGRYLNNFGHEKLCNCFLTLSPHKSYLNYIHLSNLLLNLQNYFHTILVVDGFFNERWNLKLFGDYSKQSLKVLLNEKKKLSKRLEKIKKESNLNSKITLFPWEDVILKPDYLKIETTLKEYYGNNLTFNADVNNYVKEFAKRQNREFTKLRYGVSYLIEEISMVIYLYNIKYQIEVYPGPDLQIFKNITNNKYNSFPFSFNNRTHISLIFSSS